MYKNNVVDVEDLKKQKMEILEKRRLSKDAYEREVLFNEYSKLHSKIKYYTNEEYRKNKLEKIREHHNSLRDNEYYSAKRKEYFKEYYERHKNINNVIGVC